MSRNLLIVDDERHVRQALCRVLRRDEYQIYTAENANQALDILASYPIDVIISDEKMPGMSGSVFLKEVNTYYPSIKSILLSGYNEFSSLSRAINEGGIFKFLTKPWNDEELRNTIQDAFLLQTTDELHFQYDIAFSKAIEGIVMTDANGIVLSANQAFYNLSGFDPVEVLNQPMSIIDSENTSLAILDDIDDAIYARDSWEGVLWIRCAESPSCLAKLVLTQGADVHNKISHYIYHIIPIESPIVLN